MTRTIADAARVIHTRGQQGCHYFSYDRIVDAWERDEYATRELRRD